MGVSRPHSASLRKGRFSEPGNFYFLTTTVAGRRPLFYGDLHARIVLDAIGWLDANQRFIVDAAVVMPDHLHLVGQLRRFSLGRAMHTLKSYSAHRLVDAGVPPPVWQDGYHDHALRRGEDYRSRVRYVLENPVRAGLVERVEDYRYLWLPEWWRGE
jgi:REP element-mobilizing transposase RayT